jgi:predicted nucleic acid-binding protein
LNVNDLWVAASATSRELPVVTQDADFDPVDDAAAWRSSGSEPSQK